MAIAAALDAVAAMGPAVVTVVAPVWNPLAQRKALKAASAGSDNVSRCSRRKAIIQIAIQPASFGGLIAGGFNDHLNNLGLGLVA